MPAEWTDARGRELDAANDTIADLHRELAEARELLSEWCQVHSLCSRGTLLARSRAAIDAAIAEPKEVPR